MNSGDITRLAIEQCGLFPSQADQEVMCQKIVSVLQALDAGNLLEIRKGRINESEVWILHTVTGIFELSQDFSQYRRHITERLPREEAEATLHYDSGWHQILVH